MKVAVIGAGVGGLTAALAHAQSGSEVTIYEQAPEVPAFGAGLQLGPNAVKVLVALGLGDELASCAEAPEDVQFLDAATGRTELILPLGAVIAQRHGAAFLQIHRADLIGALLAACRAAGAVIETGSRVDRACATGTLGTAKGEVLADTIIAADGVRSTIATDLFGAPPPRFSGRVAWRATVPGQGEARGTRVWLAPGAHVVTYPLRDGALMNIVAVQDTGGAVAEDWFGSASPEDLCAAFAGFPDPVQMLIERVTDVRTWGLYAHALRPSLVAGRVALLGDAAHPMLPFFAQGASMAIEDAWVHHQICAQNQPLARYEALRKARVQRVQRASTRNGRLYHASGARRLARKSAFWGLSRMPPAARLAPFDWLYGADVTALS